jgi:hypothetical protein
MTTTERHPNKFQMDKALTLDEQVKVGDTVQIRWTWGGGHYCGKAQVTKLNAKSIRAKLLHPVKYERLAGLPTGKELVVPRLFTTGWSYANGFCGTSKWQVTDPKGVYPAQEVSAFSDVDAKLEALPLMFGCPVGEVDAAVVEQTFLDLQVRHLSDW